ncbi:MAG: dual specificity protein phosphatase [Candidatus Paceibacterota bacterium]
MNKKNTPNSHSQVNYNQITDSIFIGTNFCCMAHFDEDLLDKNITIDISLEEERIDTPFGVEAYLWLPTEDNYAPNQYQFETGVEAIKNAIDNNKKVYVHCKNGHGRSPTLVIAYFMKHEDMNLKEAKDLIKSKRPEIHLHDPQIEGLKKYKNTLNN